MTNKRKLIKVERKKKMEEKIKVTKKTLKFNNKRMLRKKNSIVLEFLKKNFSI